MGRRSRKRMAEGGGSAPGGASRAERDEARRRRAASGAGVRRSYGRGRASIDDRPSPPWGNFPLVEISVLVAIVLIVGGFFVSGERGSVMFFAGLVLGSLAGLELSIREHFAGYRSHSVLLAGFMGVLTITVVTLALGKVFVPILLGAALAVFGATFLMLREAFKRRSGGVSFR